MPAKAVSWDLFVAHASQDNGAAEALYDLLSPHARVFVDTKCLELGDDWDQSLRQAQQQALMSVILISTRTDDAYYQREEIAAAIDLARSPGRHHRVVPVYLDSAASGQQSVPYGLRLKQGVVATEVGGMSGVAQRLLDALKRLRKKNADADVDEADDAPAAGGERQPLIPAIPQQPQLLYQCAFSGDPIRYFVTAADEIIAVPPGLAPVAIGRKIPPTWPGFIWMYQTQMAMFGVDQQGRIWNRLPNGFPIQIGQVYAAQPGATIG